MNEAHLKKAVVLSRIGMEPGDGGPFGAAVVRPNPGVGEGWNEVLRSQDPAAHAEIVAIRSAGRKLATYGLLGCEFYSGYEPCSMCRGAIYWSRIGGVYYSISRSDAGSSHRRDRKSAGSPAGAFTHDTASDYPLPARASFPDCQTDWWVFITSTRPRHRAGLGAGAHLLHLCGVLCEPADVL